MKLLNRSWMLGLAVLLLATGCDSNEDDDSEPLEAVRIEDIAADPTLGRDPNTGAPIQSSRYTLVSLSDSSIVLGSDEDDRSDSTGTSWDIGFQSTNIIFNGGASGPGQGAALLVEDTFENVTTAPPDDSLRVDGTATCTTATGDPGPPMAVCPGDENGWYDYDPATNLITPIPGRTLVMRTADGRFAKLRIVSYYQGAPAVPGATDPGRYYTIEYVFQEDGSRDLTSQ